MIQIQLLGNFQLLYNGEPVPALNQVRLQSLVAYLVLHRETLHLRQHLAFRLWPDSSESQARTNLRNLIFQLRHALPDADHYLDTSPQTIGWNLAAPLTLDVAELQQLLTHLQVEPLDLEALQRVVALYVGELLPSCYDDWIAPLRQQLHQAVMAALERLSTLLENQRAYATCIHYTQRLLAFNPLEEKIYRRLIRLYALEGNYTSALKVYQDCVAVLQRELNVEPDAETSAIYERLRKRDPALAAQSERTLSQIARVPLVGRQREWQTLQSVWRKAMWGQPHVVWIWGEAGIGKTRLAEELLSWAGQQGVLTAHTRSYQTQGTLAYAPVTTLLRNPSFSLRLDQLSDIWLTQVSRLLPELLDRYPDLPPPQPMTESWQRQHFFEALAHAILMDDQPQLIVFDDLHWCDQETLAWLHYLVHFAPQARLLVIGTSRSEEVNVNHPLTPLRFELRRDELLTEIELTPLHEGEVAILAQKVANDDLTVAQTQQLYADTEGNPLFVVETVRAGLGKEVEPLKNQGEFQAFPRLPPKVYAVIHSRLIRLSAQAQTICNLAAVIGRSFRFAVLAAATEADEATLIASLDELWARRILREQGTEEYDFSHDRIRDVAYAELSNARRRQLHRQVAEAFEAVYGDRLDEVCGLLADQWEQAGKRAKAVTYLQRASEHAAIHYLHTEALRHLSRAFELTPPADYATICQLLLTRERVHSIQGDRDAQKKTLELLQETLPAWLDDPQQALVIRAEVALRWSRYARRLAQPQEAINHARQAVTLAQRGNATRQETEGRIEWGHSLWSQANFALARAQFVHALRTAEAANLPACLAESLERLAQVDMFSGGSATGVMRYLERALENYGKAGDLIGTCNIHNKLGYLPVAQGIGDYGQARWHYEQALALCRKIGDPVHESTILRNLGVLCVCEGKYSQAEQHLEAARQMFIQRGAPDDVAIVLNCLGFSYFNQGQLGQAKSVQERALQQLRQVQFPQWEVKALTALGWIHLVLGDLGLAVEYASQARQASQAINEQRQAAYASTCLGHALLQLHRFADAVEAFQQAIRLYRQMQQDNRRMEPLAGLAQVAFTQGDLRQAQSLVEEVLAHLETHTLDYTEEGFQIYLTCYHVLHASNDRRAPAILCTAYDQLQTRASDIHHPEAQRRFWEALPGHQEVRQAAGARPPDA